MSASGLSLDWATPVPCYPASILLAPGGATLYVGSTLHRYVTPVRPASGKAGPEIYASLGADQLVVGRSGRYLFAARFAFRATAVAVIDTGARRLVRVIHAGGTSLAGLVSSPDGSRVYAIVDTLRSRAGWLLPISASDGRPGSRVGVTGQPAGIISAR